MLIKTSTLKEKALDWAVAKCGGIRVSSIQPHGRLEIHFNDENGCDTWTPSTDWAQGGPIIERERISIKGVGFNGLIEWEAMTPSVSFCHYYGIGPTPLIAAMRCYVASKLGDEVDVPEELK
jgi:hypothetical protein